MFGCVLLVSTIVSFIRQCPVEEIVAIRILPIEKIPSSSPYHGDDLKSDWGVLAIERRPATEESPSIGFLELLKINIGKFCGYQHRSEGHPLHVAACYPLDILTNLAHELAYEVGLDADRVVVSDDILNPENVQQGKWLKLNSEF